MNKKIVALGLILVVLSIFIGKAVYDSINGDQTATVLGLSIWLTGEDETTWELKNGDTIAWGDIETGELYSYTLKIINNYDTERHICFHHPKLPDGWTQTWGGNDTDVLPTEFAEGPLTLTALNYIEDPEWGWKVTAEPTS